MKRNLFLILGIVVLALALFVSCDDGTANKNGSREMTAFYVKAREAFNVSTGVSLPEISGLDLEKSHEAYDLEMEQFDEVIKNGGGEVTFDLDKGITLDAYLQIVYAIGVVFGPETEPFPIHEEGEDVDSWHKNGQYVTVHYKPETSITVIVH
ncbi:MAG: hypothetical protein II883_02165 [Spirochaetales bacterium]|nr:hypothetical protein [Spirochaetales bacterium]MBQ3728106.1 hypothetical protein [Spirochaetales bacterium]